jgi:hypothetical protein
MGKVFKQIQDAQRQSATTPAKRRSKGGRPDKPG